MSKTADINVPLEYLPLIFGKNASCVLIADIVDAVVPDKNIKPERRLGICRAWMSREYPGLRLLVAEISETDLCQRFQQAGVQVVEEIFQTYWATEKAPALRVSAYEPRRQRTRSANLKP